MPSTHRVHRLLHAIWFLAVVYLVGLAAGLGQGVIEVPRTEGRLDFWLLIQMSAILIAVGFSMSRLSAQLVLLADIVIIVGCVTLSTLPRTHPLTMTVAGSANISGANPKLRFIESRPAKGRWIRAAIQVDPKLGSVFAAGSQPRERVDGDFDVLYSIDFDGWREVADPRPAIALVGCSFTFGTGVLDDQTYASQLARYWPGYHVRNCAHSGWGTGQALRVVKGLIEEEVPPILVTYGWISHHLHRNGLRESFHANMFPAAEFPVFEPAGEEVEFRQMLPHEQAREEDTPEQDEREREVTKGMLRQMRRLCAEKGCRFVVVLLSEREVIADDREIVEFLRAEHFEVIDARAASGFYRHDSHPNPDWHRQVADIIARDPRLNDLKRSKP